MRTRIGNAALAALTLAVASCSGDGAADHPLSPSAARLAAAAAAPAVRISEIHYDNAGTDAGEAIEISAPSGTDVTGWKLVLYNGNGGATYGERTLSGTIPATCDARGVLVTSYPSNGIQNGDPDGIALVDPDGAVVEFLSYGGSFVAVGGPAAGVQSVDVGVKESGTTPAGHSLQRTTGGAGWNAPAANTFGSCNDDGEATPPVIVARVTIAPETATIARGATQLFTASAFDAADQPVPGATITWMSSAPSVATVDASGRATGLAVGDAAIIATTPNGVADTAALRVTEAPTSTLPVTRFSEIHYDNGGADTGEAIEIEGPAGTDLTGWSVVLYTGGDGTVYNSRDLTGTIPALCGARGVVRLDYPANGIQNGGQNASEPDGFALVNALGQVVEFLSYEGAFTATDGPAQGTASTNIGAAEAGNEPAGQSLQRDSLGAWRGPIAASFGACNATGGTTPPAGRTISFTGRTASEPALPVGFQDQLFATEREGSTTVATTFAWSSETPDVATVDQNGVFTALAAGTAVLRATATDGTTETLSLPTRVAAPGTTAAYANNTEFGIPTDGDASDDYIIANERLTSSYNRNRGTPNWVSYNLEATHFGAEDRCDCFTFDPRLPAEFSRYTTADYTGAGAAAGYGIDRGHLARSFDRTTGSLDNAETFYFTNIVPQAADQNQGPWAAFESYLGTRATADGREIFIVAGVAGNKGTLKDEGKVVIPASTWKVAVLLPRNQGLANVDDAGDLEIVSVVMPNNPGVRNVPWETYKVTVDSVEALSGYDVLKLLPDRIETIVESGTKPPAAAAGGPYASDEGAAVAFTGAGSTDPDGDALSYEWSFGDGASAAGVSPSHTYAQDGTYTIQLVVTDPRGLTDTTTTSATVANVAPVIGDFAGATIFPGETYNATGAFTDPGADTWRGTADYGDGTGVQPVAISGKSFSLTHGYTRAGTFTVAATIADDDAAATRSQTVTVLTPTQAAQSVIAQTQRVLDAANLKFGTDVALQARLRAVANAFDRGSTAAGVFQLSNLLRDLDAQVRADPQLSADVATLRTVLERLVRSLSR